MHPGMTTTIYLAGPDVFLPDAIETGHRKIALCEKYGLTGLFPLDNPIDVAASDASVQIFRANQAMMDRADAIVANLTPFRGPSADAGTVYELGYMAGRGRRCFAYCNVTSVYADRVAHVAAPDGRLVDAQGLTVEDFGHADNLMMIHALDDFGAALVMPRVTPSDIWHDLAAFEECLQLAAQPWR
jgi:nucleoside 2-deoxyribosyltransferase